MIKAILFDLDGTLVDITDNIDWFRNAMRDVLKNMGFAGNLTDRKLYQIQFGQNGDELMLSIGIDPDKYWSSFLELDLEKRKQLARIGLMKAYSDVGVLKKLRQNYKIAIVTDTPKKITDFELETFGLSGLFNAIVVANYRDGKPSPRTILECAKELGVKLSECLVVGDSPQDIRAAREAGVYIAVIKRKHNANGSYLNDADIVLNSLSEVEDKIKNLGGSE